MAVHKAVQTGTIRTPTPRVRPAGMADPTGATAPAQRPEAEALLAAPARWRKAASLLAALSRRLDAAEARADHLLARATLHPGEQR